MSHSITSIKHKQQKHPKVRDEQYLYNASESKDFVSHYSPAVLEAKIIDDFESMRGDFRHLAHKMRSHHS